MSNNKEKEDDKIEINNDKKINIKEKEINNLIDQEKISKLLMNKEKREKSRRKASKKKKGILDERIINKDTLIPPECTQVPYIPEKINNKQKTLVIDLDETLVHSYFEKEPPYNPDISYDIEIAGITIHISTLIRPGTYQFLEKLSNIYEIVIFTASLSQYAIPLLNKIDKNNYCKYKLFREHCYTFDNKGNPGYVKDLSKLNRDLNNIIIIDNNPDCYFLNKENGIPIKTWLNDKNDKELLKLLPYLEFLANDYIIDVRPILTKIKEGKTINFKILDEIIENYKKNKNEINFKNPKLIRSNSDFSSIYNLEAKKYPLSCKNNCFNITKFGAIIYNHSVFRYKNIENFVPKNYELPLMYKNIKI
jgi:Dullard-like phosphatase family protein